MRLPGPIALLLLPVMAVTMAGGTAPPGPASAPPPPAIASSGPEPVAAALSGPYREAARRLVLPYAKATATELGEPAWDGSLDALKALQAAHGADLVLAAGPVLAAACRAQLIDRLDWGALGRDRFLPGAASDCGVGAYVSATVLAWDRDKVSGIPGWGDFWDVAKHPGRRGLRRAARGNLEIALLADGVAPGDIYRTLRSADGVDRAFRKLDQLKPYIEWWDKPSEPAQYLLTAKVLLVSAPAASLPEATKSRIGMQWSGSLDEVASWARPAGAPHGSGALAAVGVALDAARQAEFAHDTGLGPATRTGVALLPAELRPRNPSEAANLQAGLMIDEGFWLDNGEKLEARFAAWIGK